MRLSHFVCLILILLLFRVPGVFAQSEEASSTQDAAESQGAPDASEPIVNIQEQPYKYYYWPDEDLNNFGLSSMGGGKTGTTLGSTSERKSNLEVNATEKPEDERQDGAESPEDEDIEPDSTTAPDYGDETTGASEDYSPTPASDTPIYKWVDDKGTIHITNNLGDVPLEYQQDYYKRKENDENNPESPN